MRHKFLIIIILSIICNITSSCVPPDGLQEPIEMDKSEVVFGKDGGTETVRTTNYDGWLLYDFFSFHDEKNYPIENLQRVIADGISAEVVDNSVIVTAEPSEQSRKWEIYMKIMNTGTSIMVKQN